MDRICYLCGLPIVKVELSEDHTIPKCLISRKQPKMKGFDYGGKLPTHAVCNNRFGPEIYCSKALEIIAVLNDENCPPIFQHKDDPSIVMMGVNSECLKDFTDRDLRFFKFIDLRNKGIKEFWSPSFFSDKPKTDPMRDSLFVALAVLTKSAAALLVARHLCKVPNRWRVLAITHSGTEGIDFDDVLGITMPFDIGVKVWLKHLGPGYWLATYSVRDILVIFLFRFSDSAYLWDHTIREFADVGPLYFEGTQLVELIDYQWRRA